MPDSPPREPMRPREAAASLYRAFLRSSGLARYALSFAKRAVGKLLHDPDIVMTVHGRDLYMPCSHALPQYLYQLKYYDRLPGRIAAYLRSTQQRVCAIDVGANIGDTIAAFAPGQGDRVLAIEPSERFFRYLAANWGAAPNVTLMQALVSADEGDGRYTIRERAGTAEIAAVGAGGIEIPCAAVDSLVEQLPAFREANLLKIDTDGHDFKVLAGAMKLLQAQRPAVLFECDVFGNPDYVTDCASTFGRLADCGYDHCLVYDNAGRPFGRYGLHEFDRFKGLLFYQLVHRKFYYDILVMADPDLAAFQASEAEFFARHTVSAVPAAAMQALAA